MKVIVYVEIENGEDEEERRYFLHGLYRFLANEHGVEKFGMMVDGDAWPEEGWVS